MRPVRIQPRSSSGIADRGFRAIRGTAAGFVLALIVALVFVLVVQSWPALASGISNGLFTSAVWEPERGIFGAWGFIYGSAVTTAIALAIAVPLGVGSAAYLSELASPRIRRTCILLLEPLATVPGVVFGFWAKAVLAPAVLFALVKLGVPGVAIGSGGQGLFTAGLVLALMILPYIAVVSFAVYRSAPRNQREAAYALGSTRWQVLSEVVLPYGRRAVIAAVFLALSRAAGETMAVTMVVGNSDAFLFSPFAPGDTVPSTIVKHLPEVSGDRRAALTAMGLMLLAATTFTHLTARWLVSWAAKPRSLSGFSAVYGTGTARRLASGLIGKCRRKQCAIDRVMGALLALCTFATVAPLLVVIATILYRGASELDWHSITELPPPFGQHGGLGHALLGSAMMVGMAAFVAVPLGWATALYLADNDRRRTARSIRFAADLLGGVPPIVVGIFAYALLVDPFWYADHRWGFSAWAGAFALAVLMLPVMIRTGEEALKQIPAGLSEASYSLGASRWQTARRIVLPAAMPALIAGALMAIGRVAGEAAPLVLAAGGSNFWPRDPGEPTASLPYFINDYSHDLGRSGFERLGWIAAFVLVVGVGLAHATAMLASRNRPSSIGRVV